MGYLSSSTTTVQQAQTAPLSPEGEEYKSMVNSFMLMQMQMAGYVPQTQEKTIYQNPQQAATYQSQIKNYQAEVDRLSADLSANPPPGNPKVDPRTLKLNAAMEKLNRANEDLSKIPQNTYTNYTFEKAPDPRVAAAEKEFGKNSPQVNDIKNQIAQDEVYTAQASADISRSYLQATQKLVNGDYSYTDDQKIQTEKYFGPIAETLSNTTDKLLTEADRGDQNLFEYVNKFKEEIDRTGFDTMDALNAALLQVDQSEGTLLSVVDSVNRSDQARAKFQFDLLSQQADQKAASQAALLGLPPGSMVEKKQAAVLKYNALQQTILDADVRASERTLGIVSQAEGQKNAISLDKVNLAATQGSKYENLAGTSLGIAQQSNATRMGIRGVEADAQNQIAKDKMNLLFNAAVGQLPGQVAGAQGYQGFSSNMLGAQIAQGQQLISPAQQGLGIEQQRTFAEAKNTSKTTTTPSTFSAITAGISAAAGAASGIMTGFGAMQK